MLRTSTPEPTPLGIIWTQLKDVSTYLPVFARSGYYYFFIVFCTLRSHYGGLHRPLVLDLGNLISSTLTGEYDSKEDCLTMCVCPLRSIYRDCCSYPHRLILRIKRAVSGCISGRCDSSTFRNHQWLRFGLQYSYVQRGEYIPDDF